MWLCAMWMVLEDHKTTFWNQSNENEINGYRERQKDLVIVELCWHEILKEENWDIKLRGIEGERLGKWSPESI